MAKRATRMVVNYMIVVAEMILTDVMVHNLFFWVESGVVMMMVCWRLL